MKFRGHFRRVRKLFNFHTLEEDRTAFEDPDNENGQPSYGVCCLQYSCYPRMIVCVIKYITAIDICIMRRSLFVTQHLCVRIFQLRVVVTILLRPYHRRGAKTNDCLLLLLFCCGFNVHPGWFF